MDKIERHITIVADPGDIFEQLILWGESAWWPERSLMKFINLSGRIAEGTEYLQKVSLPFGPKWHSRNSTVDMNNLYLKRIYLDGIFAGSEELLLKRVSPEACEVRHVFNYEVRGFFNKLLWKMLFQRLHSKNLDLILKSLKNYLERR